MVYRNTATSYGNVSKVLHWSIALLIIAAYVFIYWRHWFLVEQTPLWKLVGNLHRSCGIAVGLLVVFRIIWRLSNPVPEPPPGTKWEHLGASLAHFALYFFMVIMPLTGYLGSHVGTNFMGMNWFSIPDFSESQLFQWLVIDSLGITWDEWEVPVDFIHKNSGAFLVWVLILMHIGAALYHHYHRKDGTLLRMLPKGRNQN